MTRDIVTDPMLLSRKSVPATQEDIQTARDLLDTVIVHADHCVGMAANMIGVCKRIMAAQIGGKYQILINPEVTDHSVQKYTAEEGCLSLKGVRTAERYAVITVSYYDEKFRQKKRTFRGFEAQIIQHEMDHFEGILI